MTARFEATVALTALLLCCSAIAQSPDTKSEEPSPNTSSPVPTGSPHVCSTRPAISQRVGDHARTLVSFQIATDGTVKDVVVKQSSGAQALDDAAVECAKRWTYRPAMQDGHPVEVPWSAIVTWTLV